MANAGINGSESLGLIETRGLLPMIAAADAMVKAANVEVLDYERVGSGKLALWVRGSLSAVRVAVEAGREAVGTRGEVTGSAVLARPDSATASLAGVQTSGNGRHRTNGGPLALGVLETKGYVALVVGIEAMVKSAEVDFISYERLGGGILTAIVTGEIAAVETATASGAEAASRAGEVVGVNVIARPDPGMVAALPIGAQLEASEARPALKGEAS